MAGSESLSQRIKAEFDTREQRQKTETQEQAQRQQDREKRLVQFNKVCEDLKGIWKPRLEEFAKQFGDKIKVTPTIEPESRAAKIEFMTELANVTLGLIASADSEITKLILDYDLRIIPMFFEYERHAKLEMPLDKIDPDAIGKWIDDRLISCVKAYISIQDNDFYRQRAMVEDPISKVRFLREEAKAKMEHEGKTIYFSSEESMRQYKQKLQLDQPAAKADNQEEKAAGTTTPETGGNVPARNSPAPTVVTKPGQALKPQNKP